MVEQGVTNAAPNHHVKKIKVTLITREDKSRFELARKVSMDSLLRDSSIRPML